jgi:hypothetical protein
MKREQEKFEEEMRKRQARLEAWRKAKRELAGKRPPPLQQIFEYAKKGETKNEDIVIE